MVPLAGHVIRYTKLRKLGNNFSGLPRSRNWDPTLPYPTKLAKKIFGMAKIWARFARMMFEV